MTKTASKSNLSERFSKAASTNRGRVHVVPSKDGWSVKREGIKRSRAVKSTKEGAIKFAFNVKSAERIVVHKKDGSIQRNEKR